MDDTTVLPHRKHQLRLQQRKLQEHHITKKPVLLIHLKVVGKIENLASGESLYAARFMGNRCYLVTFQQVDPLFVVDLTQPTNPKVLGNLTIPGYSNFLQPYDATHLIGIGQDVNASIDADKVHQDGAIYYTAILGLKVSLFDVSDVAHPQEISKLSWRPRHQPPATFDCQSHLV